MTSQAEQYLLELINRARLDPQAEADRYGIDLNENLSQGTISADPKQVLAPSEDLELAARLHSQWMLEADVFSHTGEGGSSLRHRVEESGYVLSGSWRIGENIAWSGTSGSLDLDPQIDIHHRGLFLSSGHRRNLLNGTFREIGIAQEEGDFTYDERDWNTSMLTEKFAKSGSSIFVTGVVYDDLDSDDFFSIGEGRSGATFTVGNVSDVSADAGGFAVAVSPQEVLTVSINFQGFQGSLSVEPGGENAKVDLVDGTRVLLSKSASLLTGFTDALLLGLADISLDGSAADDNLTGNQGNNILIGNGGNDSIRGGVGADTLNGESGEDSLFGDAGNDLINGGNGSDSLLGGDGDDTLEGGFGNDTIFGNAYDDVISSVGGVNLLFGGSGADEITGGSSLDTLNGGTGADSMDGQDRSDTYFVDGGDIVTDTGITGYDKAQINNTAGVALDLTGWTGVERINGFSGTDTIDASASSENLIISGEGGADSIMGGSGDDILLGGAGNDTLSGGAGNDTILGGTETDLLEGGPGADVFFVDETLDAITDGGDGFDKAIINNASGLSIAIGSWVGVERINGYIGQDTIDATGLKTDIVIASSDEADSVTGGSGDDSVYAGTGADSVDGGAGNDVLIGSTGNDTLNGGADNDFLRGGADADVFEFDDGFGQDIVKDFLNDTDSFDFSLHSGVNSFDDLTKTQDGSHTVLTLTAGGTDRITLFDVDEGLIGANDFAF